jgi:hypothetical protein
MKKKKKKKKKKVEENLQEKSGIGRRRQSFVGLSP